MEYRGVSKCDSSSEMTHWKYVKREKKNGKWSYQYGDERPKNIVKYMQSHEPGGVTDTMNEITNDGQKQITKNMKNAGKQINDIIRKDFLKTSVWKAAQDKMVIERGKQIIIDLFKKIIGTH